MVSFGHGFVTLAGKGCAVIRKEPLFFSVSSEGRSQMCLLPEPLGQRCSRQFIGNITYNYVVFAVGVACTGIDQGSPTWWEFWVPNLESSFAWHHDVTTKQRCRYSTSADTQNAFCKLSYSHSLRVACDRECMSLLGSRT